MRVVVVGATGNLGTSLLQRLADDPQIEYVLGLARRKPELELPKTEWAEADIEVVELEPYLRGADAVVLLAWRVQPSHDLEALWRTNVDGSTRVFRATAAAGVPALVYASSVGAYSAGPKDPAVDESWPTNGIPTSHYARHKAEVERRLDRFEREHPAVRVVRLRPGLIFKREAGSGIRRLFAGPLLPSRLVRPDLLPFVPDHPRLRFQGLHSRDAGEAFRLAVTREVRGAFNLAADPALDPPTLARVLRARPVRVSPAFLRAVVALSWRLHLQPTPPGWIDLLLGVPLLDTTRAREELGWTPAHRADDALLELLDGVRSRAGIETPPLEPRAGGASRVREFLSGIGTRGEAA